MKENEKRAKIKNVIVNSIGVIIFFIICAIITVSVWPKISEFIKNPQKIRYLAASRGDSEAVAIFLLLQIFQVVVAIIPGEALEIGAGAAFGWLGGFILAEIGVALGTALIFAVSRIFGKRFTEALTDGKKIKRFEKLNESKQRDGIIFLVFLIPGLPKDMLTYAASFFDIKLMRFLLITSIARIPSILSSTVAADFVIKGNYLFASLIFILTAAISVLCFLLSEKIMTKIGLNKGENNKNKNKY